MQKTIVIVGAGEGLGNAIARKFGQQDFRVILIARTEFDLKTYCKNFKEEGIEAHYEVADAAKPDSLTAAFARIKTKFGTPEVMVYNVGVNGMDESDLSSAILLQRYQIDVASAHHCVRQVLNGDLAKKKGAIFFTGGGLALHPRPKFLSLSTNKSALRTMALLLHEELKPQGIYVGTVTINGPIDPKTKFAPDKIAQTYWDLYKKRDKAEVIYE